jgi:hypothetical protein
LVLPNYVHYALKDAVIEKRVYLPNECQKKSIMIRVPLINSISRCWR